MSLKAALTQSLLWFPNTNEQPISTSCVKTRPLGRGKETLFPFSLLFVAPKSNIVNHGAVHKKVNAINITSCSCCFFVTWKCVDTFALYVILWKGYFYVINKKWWRKLPSAQRNLPIIKTRFLLSNNLFIVIILMPSFL